MKNEVFSVLTSVCLIALWCFIFSGCSRGSATQEDPVEASPSSAIVPATSEPKPLVIEGPEEAFRIMNQPGALKDPAIRRVFMPRDEGDPVKLLGGDHAPLPGMLVEVFRYDQGYDLYPKQSMDDTRILWRSQTDSNGVFNVYKSSLIGNVLRVYHPEYGMAGLGHIRGETARLPLIHNDSPLVEQATKGVVRNVAGKPVANVAMHIQHFRVKNQTFVPASHSEAKSTGFMLTDTNGGFRGYLPSRSEGSLVAKSMAYRVALWKPSYFPAEPLCPAGEAQEITLQQGRFHRFELEGLQGAPGIWHLKYRPEKTVALPPNTPTGLHAHLLSEWKLKQSVRLPSRYLMEGGPLIPGIYSVKSFSRKETREVEVTANSPELIVFPMSPLPER